MTVEENLSFGLKLQKLPSDEIGRRVRDAIDMVELKGKEKEYPGKSFRRTATEGRSCERNCDAAESAASG